MKRIILALAMFLMGFSQAQYYNDYYYSGQFPDEYYYDFPGDYYADDYYASYYNDYRRSINSVDWNRFFYQYNLTNSQARRVAQLNRKYPTYGSFMAKYRYNPDRWYYDRFYALRNILGSKVYALYQNQYYRGNDPIAYHRQYRVNYYEPRYQVNTRYRDYDVRQFRNSGFRNTDRPVYRQNDTSYKRSSTDGFKQSAPGPKTEQREIRTERRSNEQSGFRTQPAEIRRTQPTAENTDKTSTDSGRRSGGFRTR